MKIGQGTHQYEVDHNWLKLPDHVKLGYTHGIVTDRKDNLYVFNTSEHAMVICDKEGRFLDSWGSEYATGAHGCLLHEENGVEYLYLTDVAELKVVKTTLGGEVLLTLMESDIPDIYDGDKKRFVPTDVAVAPNGDIYVGDGYGQSWVHRFSAAGKHIQSWGGPGSEAGKMSCPHGVSVDLRHDEPEIYVADRGNQRIQVFTMEGEHKRFVTDEMDAPCSFFYHEGEVYLPDLHSRVTVLDKQDKLIVHLGANPEAWQTDGWPNLPVDQLQEGKFNSPHGVCVDGQGNIYLAEWIVYGRVTRMKRV